MARISRSAESDACAGSILVEQSTLSDSLKLQGVVAQGLNSTVFISNSSIFDCSGTCVLALQGGCIDMEKCKVYSSTTMQGVCAQGKGSKINLKNSRGLRLCMMINLAVCNLFTVYDCMQTCVVSLNGGAISMFDCACFGSSAMQGVCSEGANSVVELENCTVHSHLEACVAALSSGFVSAKNCKIYNSERSRGVSIEGVSSKAIIENCSVYQCHSASVCVLGGAQCNVISSQLRDTIGSNSQCVCVQGPGSKCSIEKSSVSDSSGTCIVALAGGCVMLQDTNVFGSVTMQGISSQGNDSTIIADKCSISNTREACVASLRGGLVRLVGCSISRSMSRGVSVEGSSVVELLDCTIDRCVSCCAAVVEGGKLFATNSIFQETVAAHGQGICAQGSSSAVTLIGCTISKICATGIVCLSAASVHVDDCAVISCGLQGCTSQGKGSSVVAKNSKFSKCEESACACLAGGFMNLIGCQMSESYSGVCCEGRGTTVAIDACTVFKNEQSGIIIVDGGNATIMNSMVSNQDSSMSQGITCHGLGSRVLASDCAIENTSKCGVSALDGGYVTLRCCKILRSLRSHLLLAQGSESTIKCQQCVMHSSLLACIVAMAGGSINVFKCNVSASSLRQILLSHGSKSLIVARESQIHTSFGTCVLAICSGTCSLSQCLVHSSETMQGVCAEGFSSHVSAVKCVIQECKHSLTLACGGGLVELDGCRLIMAQKHAVCSQNPKSIVRVQGCTVHGSLASLGGGSVMVSNSFSDSKVMSCGSGSFVAIRGSSISSTGVAGLLVSDAARANVDQCMVKLSEIQVQGKNSIAVISQSIVSATVKTGEQCPLYKSIQSISCLLRTLRCCASKQLQNRQGECHAFACCRWRLGTNRC